MQKVIWILLGAFAYFAIFMAEQFSPLPKIMPWFAANGLIAICVFFILFTKTQLKHKILFSLLSIFLGFILSFVYTFVAQTHAEWDLCKPLVETQFQCEVITNGECSKYRDDPRDSKGFSKSWKMQEECAAKLMPFPWGKKPTLQ